MPPRKWVLRALYVNASPQPISHLLPVTSDPDHTLPLHHPLVELYPHSIVLFHVLDHALPPPEPQQLGGGEGCYPLLGGGAGVLLQLFTCYLQLHALFLVERVIRCTCYFLWHVPFEVGLRGNALSCTPVVRWVGPDMDICSV